MNKIPFVIIFFVTELLNAQNPLVKQWDAIAFGGNKEDFLFDFKQTDGGFIPGGIALYGQWR